jgi:hypothetical protein
VAFAEKRLIGCDIELAPVMGADRREGHQFLIPSYDEKSLLAKVAIDAGGVILVGRSCIDNARGWGGD